MLLNEHKLAVALRAGIDVEEVLASLHDICTCPNCTLDSDGNTCLHYASAFNHVRFLNVVIAQQQERWWTAVLAVNERGQTVLDVVRGAEARDRLAPLEPLALKQAHDNIAKAKSEGRFPDLRQVGQNATAIGFFLLGLALVLHFRVLGYPWVAAALLFLLGPRFAEPVTDEIKIRSDEDYMVDAILAEMLGDRAPPRPQTTFFKGGTASVVRWVFLMAVVAPLLELVHHAFHGVVCLGDTCFRFKPHHQIRLDACVLAAAAVLLLVSIGSRGLLDAAAC